MIHAISENRILSRWAALLPRGPSQRGAIHESDAELLPLGDGRLLALTIDQVVEEVALGLYRQAETVGRIAATASLSDLAAVGAEVLGLLISVTIPNENPVAVQDSVAIGILDVTARAQTYVMGGDTSEGAQLSIACTAVGTVPESQMVSRLGAAPGDTVYVTGALGLGAAMAAVRFLDLSESLLSEQEFRPPLRLREGQALRGLMACCMDTSDGLIATLDQLALLNGVAVVIEADPGELLHPSAERVRAMLGLAATPFLAATHGEFELAFTVASCKQALFRQVCDANGLAPVRVGRVATGRGVHLFDRCLDTVSIRNLAAHAGRNPRQYIEGLLALCA